METMVFATCITEDPTQEGAWPTHGGCLQSLNPDL